MITTINPNLSFYGEPEAWDCYLEEREDGRVTMRQNLRRGSYFPSLELSRSLWEEVLF